MKKVFVCSPYRGNQRENTEFARLMCRAVACIGHAPFAPHLLYTQFLKDSIEFERSTGIAAGKAFLSVCDELWVCCKEPGDSPSEGMIGEIWLAKKLEIPVFEFCVESGDLVEWKHES